VDRVTGVALDLDRPPIHHRDDCVRQRQITARTKGIDLTTHLEHRARQYSDIAGRVPEK
jgi:hypothetical protein